MIWVIVTIIVLLIIRTIYVSTGFYQVLVKVKYSLLKNDNKWIIMFTGSYRDCVSYVRNSKRTGTDALGFRESFKIKRIKL